MKNPKALITGINGFTGRYVASELQAHGWEVWGAGSQPDSSNSHFYSVDLLDFSSLKEVVDNVQPDVVVHLAAISFVGHDDINAFYNVNLLGTRNLLAALAGSAHPPRCVLLSSSANVYGNTTEGMLSESAPPNPANDYAVSKLAMEYMAQTWMNKIPILIVRPFNYTGVGQSEEFLLPKIVKHFRERATAIELGNLDIWRDFSDVRAVAQAYRRLLQICPAGITVNICTGCTYSLREVLGIMERISGHTLDIRVNPALVRINEVRLLSGNPDNLRRLIGDWQSPLLEDTLRWMLEAA